MATNLTRRGASANNAARLPALPASTAADPSRRQWEELVREWLEVRLGARGDFFERAVTHRELREQLDALVAGSDSAAEIARLQALINALRSQLAGINRQVSLLQSLIDHTSQEDETDIQNLETKIRDVAVEDVAVFARDMLPSAVNGCSALTVINFGATKPNFHTLLFDAAAQESADFHAMLPFQWAGRKFKVYVYWGHGSGGTDFDVAWEIRANSTSDNETVILDFVGGPVIYDTGGVAGNLYIAEASAAVPIASNRNRDGDMVSLRILRKTADENDTMDIDAALLAVRFTLSDVPFVNAAEPLAMFYAMTDIPDDTVTGPAADERVAFMARVTGVDVEDFEGFSPSTSTSQPVVLTMNGTTCTVKQLVTQQDIDLIDVEEVQQDPKIYATGTLVGRFNTTAAGSQWMDLRVQTGSDIGAPSGLPDGRWRAQFTFSTAIAAFGFYGTDFGDFSAARSIKVELTDSDSVVTEHTITPEALYEDANLMFWGFADGEKTYTKVVIFVDPSTLDSPQEGLGIDDLVFCTAAYLT